MSSSEAQDNNPVYTGGNELFFSIISALLRGVDEGLISREGLHEVVASWAASWATKAGVTGNLERDLDKISDALVSLGLVRVFEPAPAGSGEEVKVLVLRCLFGRHVGRQRVREGLSHRCMLIPMIEGALGAGGTRCTVTEDRQGMLRSDECLLLIRRGEKE